MQYPIKNKAYEEIVKLSENKNVLITAIKYLKKSEDIKNFINGYLNYFSIHGVNESIREHPGYKLRGELEIALREFKNKKFNKFWIKILERK
jgi:hypothetical protein